MTLSGKKDDKAGGSNRKFKYRSILLALDKEESKNDPSLFCRE